MKQDKENLKKLPILDIINYIKTSLLIVINIKLKEELEKQKDEKIQKKISEEIAAEDYETLLRKEEAEIRQHISIEHQFKIQCEKYAQELDSLEDEKSLLLMQIVSNQINIF